jgi:hypothetical protein
MTTLRTLGKWWVPLAGIWFVVTGLSLLTGGALPAVVMGALAVIVGILALLAS